MFVHQDGVHWCVQEFRARLKRRSQGLSAAASSQGSREQVSDMRSELFREVGDLWALKVSFSLGDIPVSCVTAANERVAAKVRQTEGRVVERLLH